MDLRLALMCGTDIPVPECKISIHQPRIEEIAFIGEESFFSGAQLLCLNKSMFIQDKTLLDTTTNFQIFMMIMSEKTAKQKKEDLKNICSLLFPSYTVLITPKSLLLTKPGEENIIIDESNFEIIQKAFRLIFCTADGPMDQQTFNPANEKAKQIADKIMAGRKKVAELKGSNNVSVFSQYLSMLTIGIHISMLDLMKLTMFQLYDLVERFMLWTNWDIDLRSRLAGGKPNEHPENWMKNIH